MKGIRIENLTYSIKGRKILNEINFDVKPSELFTVLGPSGCGKTSLLRLIAGLNSPDKGSIYLADQCVSSPQSYLKTEKRKVGFIFQNYALFPHKTVRENIVFSIEYLPAKKIQKILDELVNLIELKEHLDKYPHQLSGGEQQRVALARSLSLKPHVLLMDEPFSNLDPSLRKHLLYEVKKLLKKLEITTIMVTHSRSEAFDFSDRIMLLNAGEVAQVGTATDLYTRPTNRFVADFVGTTSWLKGKLESSGSGTGTAAGTAAPSASELFVETQLGTICCQPSHISYGDGGGAGDNRVEVMLRPENVVLASETPKPPETQENNPGVKGILKSLNYRGSHRIFEAELENGEIVTGHCHGPIPAIGSKIYIAFSPTPQML